MGVCAVNDAGSSKKRSNTEEVVKEELSQGNIRGKYLAALYLKEAVLQDEYCFVGPVILYQFFFGADVLFYFLAALLMRKRNRKIFLASMEKFTYFNAASKSTGMI
jgi:hypothetical protein